MQRLPPMQSTQEKGRSRWPKLLYDNYVSTARNQYKVGDIVTLASIPVSLTYFPATCYRITYIEEIWYQVEYDDHLLDPKCILVSSHHVHYPLIKFAPTRLRKLVEAELKHNDNPFTTITAPFSSD